MTLTAAPSREITRREFQDVAEILRTHAGIALVPGKEALVMGRLNKRLRQLGLRSYGEYLRLLRRPGQDDEVHQAIDLLTTNETSFFREPIHFEYLGGTIAPAHDHGRRFRLWSAASSSGEEAYSAAMVLAETMPEAPWEVVGSDISTRVVRCATRGVYSLAAAERVPWPLRRKYCRKGRDEYDGLMSITPELRARVRFTCANLMEDLTRLGRFDVIVLRNVMIYFDLETRARLILRMQEMLQPGGYLIVGLSESLNGVPSRLRLIESSIYQLVGGERA